jgi:hypothetical protein
VTEFSLAEAYGRGLPVGSRHEIVDLTREAVDSIAGRLDRPDTSRRGDRRHGACPGKRMTCTRKHAFKWRPMSHQEGESVSRG